MTNETLTLDPRAQKVQNVAKAVGTGAVVVAASGAIIVTGASVIVASIVGVAALFMVNFVVPVAARSIALYRQKTLTALTEAFSEETIREDESKESDRIRTLENQYVTSRSELEGAQEELEKQIKDSTPEEKEMLKSQIDSLQEVIDTAEVTLKQRKEDFKRKCQVVCACLWSAQISLWISNKNPIMAITSLFICMANLYLAFRKLK